MFKRRSKQRSGPRGTGPVNKFPYRLWQHCARNSGKQKDFGGESESKAPDSPLTRALECVMRLLPNYYGCPNPSIRSCQGQESYSSSGRDGWKGIRKRAQPGVVSSKQDGRPSFFLACWGKKRKEKKQKRVACGKTSRETLPNFPCCDSSMLPLPWCSGCHFACSCRRTAWLICKVQYGAEVLCTAHTT